MSNSIATSISTTPLLPPVNRNSQHAERVKQTGSYLGPFENRMRCLQVAKSGVRLSAQFLPIDRRRPIMPSTRMQSASVICASGLSARGAASVEEQTQTIKHKAPTITHIPGKEKSPKLYDGGFGFPPRDDDGGGGGGGGGGDNSSGGWILLGILGFLGFLKDLETQGKERE